MVSVCLLVAMVLPLLCGCVSHAEGGKKQLWVLTEKSTWDRMNGQLYVLEQAYEKEHPDVDIRVEYLPTEEQKRASYLQQLRTQILQGGGPDCYLLPTDNTLIMDEPAQYTYVEVEPLFSDVQLAMQNGLFYNIADLYDRDDTLGKEALNPQIMAAGTLGEKRYVLPLRYDLPVIFAKESALQAAGIDPAILQKDLGAIMEAVCQREDPILAGGLFQESFSVFTDFFNYETGEVELQEQTLTAYFRIYQQLKALRETLQEDIYVEKLHIPSYISHAYDPKNTSGYDLRYYPLWIGTMQDAFDYLPMAQYENTELQAVPMRSIGGDVVATVTYYAAVGAGCKDPNLAYDFLRQFLLETSQWEKNRPVRNYTKPVKGMGNTVNDLQFPGLMEKGWAVRSQGSLQTLWNVRRTQFYVKSSHYFGTPEQRDRMRIIGLMALETDRWAEIQNAKIDQVRFHTSLSDDLAEVLQQLDLGADHSRLAQELLWAMRRHIAEG